MSSAADRILIATSPQSSRISPSQQISAGFISGAFARTVTSPLDVVKTILQASTAAESPMTVAKRVLKEDGITAFWRGNIASCIRLGPQTSLKFIAFEELQRIVGGGIPLSGAQRTIVGAVSGIISQVITYPLDVIRTRMIISPKKYKGIFSAMRSMIKEEGARSLYSGLLPTVIGVIPYEGAQFYAYGGLRNFYSKRISPGHQISPLANCIIASVAGMLSQTIAYPFDVVRRRMMVVADNGKPQFSGMKDAFVNIYKKEGFCALYRGVSINLIKIVPFAALQFTFSEEIKRVFAHINERRSEVQ